MAKTNYIKSTMANPISVLKTGSDMLNRPDALLFGASMLDKPKAQNALYVKPSTVSKGAINGATIASSGSLASNSSSITPTTSTVSDIESRINALNQAKQAQAISDLGKARDSQLSNLTSEQSTIIPLYYDKRNANAATNMANRRTLAEELASRGESRSGVADQANINANMSLQSDQGSLNRQEAAALTDIARRRSDVQNAYESDVASAKAQLEATAMQNLIDQFNADRTYKLQEAGVTGLYNGNQTLDALYAAKNFALNEAGVTGLYNGNQTLAAQNQSFNQDLSTKQYNLDAEKQKLDELYRQKTYDYQLLRDAVKDKQWQQQMNLDLRTQTFAEAQAKIDNALSQQRITQSEADQALQWAQFNAEQDPNSLDNQYKQAQINSTAQSNNASQLNTIIDNFNSLYTSKTYDQKSGTSTVTPNKSAIIGALQASVESGKMSEDMAKQVAGYYGIILPDVKTSTNPVSGSNNMTQTNM